MTNLVEETASSSEIRMAKLFPTESQPWHFLKVWRERCPKVVWRISYVVLFWTLSKYIPTTTYLGTIFWSTASIFVRPYFLLTCWENGQGLLQTKSPNKAKSILVSDWNHFRKMIFVNNPTLKANKTFCFQKQDSHFHIWQELDFEKPDRPFSVPIFSQNIETSEQASSTKDWDCFVPLAVL